MTAHYDARKVAEAATEIRAAVYDLTDVEHRRFVHDAVAAAAPILLAAERARIAAAIRRLGETAQIDGALVLPLHPLVLDYIEEAACIAETALDVPMSPIKGHAETAPEEGP